MLLLSPGTSPETRLGEPKLIPYIGSSGIFVNHPGQEKGSWVLGGSNYRPSSLGEPELAGAAIDSLARHISTQFHHADSWLDRCKTARLYHAANPKSLEILDPRGPVFSLNSDGRGVLHQSSLGPEAFYLAALVRAADLEPQPGPTLAIDRLLDLFTDSHPITHAIRAETRKNAVELYSRRFLWQVAILLTLLFLVGIPLAYGPSNVRYLAVLPPAAAAFLATYLWHLITTNAQTAARHQGTHFENRVADILREDLHPDFTVAQNVTTPLGVADLDTVVTGRGYIVVIDAKHSVEREGTPRFLRNRAAANSKIDDVRTHAKAHKLISGNYHLKSKLIVCFNGAPRPLGHLKYAELITVAEIADLINGLSWPDRHVQSAMAESTLATTAQE